ncbi:MAG: dipeptidase [Bacteroidetes bacterium]|nr:dipeptidase [Bacteroidota bacterium]
MKSKNLIFLLFLFLNCQCLFSQFDYKKFHHDSFVADTHNDVLLRMMEGENLSIKTTKGHSDLIRFKDGGVDAQFFSVWVAPSFLNVNGVDESFNRASAMIDSLNSLIKNNPDKIGLAKNYKDVLKLNKQNKLAALIGVEGGYPILDNIDFVDTLYSKGMRYMTLTWNLNTPWATSAREESRTDTVLQFKGLTEKGKQIVSRMNRLGIIVDVSHIGPQTLEDVLQISTKPVIASHSCVYNITPAFRNLKDDQLKAIAKNSGVVFINFYAAFIDSTFHIKADSISQFYKPSIDSIKNLKLHPDDESLAVETFLSPHYEPIRPELSQLVDHFEYIIKLIGVDHVGIGSDFDGVTALPKEMDDVTFLPNLTRELFKRGYSKKDVKKILGENFLRVLKANSP